MHSHHHYHSHQTSGSQGPAWFYGYCHDSGQMKMMTYPDYVNNMQTTYSKLYSSPGSMAQQYADMLQGRTSSTTSKSECSCHECQDCGCDCSCHIHCADAVEYVRCGEVRQIPITFENDTRRDRNVVLTLGTFATASGREMGWQPSLSDTTFTLPACGEKTVLLMVPVQCGNSDPAGDNPNAPGKTGQVDTCTVAYATLRAEGYRVRPLVIAVAILPNYCRSHRVDCSADCCC